MIFVVHLAQPHWDLTSYLLVVVVVVVVVVLISLINHVTNNLASWVFYVMNGLVDS